MPTPKKSVAFQSADGRTLNGFWWAGADSGERSLVLLPGLAVPQSAFLFFAKYLADRGWGVLSFDYRGVARSREKGGEDAICLDDWMDLDLPAAAAQVKSLANPKFLGAVAHSIGGQLLGMSPMAERVDGALLICAQRGMPRFFSGRGKWSVRYAYTAFPLLIRILGRLPVSKLTFPVACPAGAVLQWVRWGKTGVFTDRSGRDIERRFENARFPVAAVTVGDDAYAPSAAVEALTGMYRAAASVRRELVDPREFGIERIGHFGFFHRAMPTSLWERADTWLRQMAGAAENPAGNLE